MADLASKGTAPHMPWIKLALACMALEFRRVAGVDLMEQEWALTLTPENPIKGRA